VDGQTISSIGKGLLVLIGIDKRMSSFLLPSFPVLSPGRVCSIPSHSIMLMEDDEPSDSTTIIKKILGAKLFDDETGAWKKDVRDIEGEVLCG